MESPSVQSLDLFYYIFVMSMDTPNTSRKALNCQKIRKTDYSAGERQKAQCAVERAEQRQERLTKWRERDGANHTIYRLANCLYQLMHCWYRQFAPSGNLTIIESDDGIVITSQALLVWNCMQWRSQNSEDAQAQHGHITRIE